MNLSVLCFRKFSVAKKFIDKRGGEYQDFPSKNVSLTVPKFSEGAGGEHFSVSLISGIEKVWIRGGEYRDFTWKFFCLTVPKNLAGEYFIVSLIFGIENFYVSEGYVTIVDFLSKFFCLTVPKKFVGEPFCAVFQQKFMDKRGWGVSGFSVEKFSSQSAEHFRRGWNHLVLHEFRVSKKFG